MAKESQSPPSSPILVRIRDKRFEEILPDKAYSLHVHLSNSSMRTLKHYRFEIFVPKFLNPKGTKLEDLGTYYDKSKVPHMGFAKMSEGEVAYIFPGQTVHLIGEPSELSGLSAAGRSLIHYAVGINQEHLIGKHSLRWKFYADNMEAQDGSINIVDIVPLSD